MNPRSLVSPVILGLLATGATAQIERPIPYPLPEDPDWTAALEAGTRTEAGVPGPSYWTNYAEYSIQAELIPETAVVRGHIDMTYHNRSPEEIRRLMVHLRHNLHKEGSLRNRYVEITGGVEVSELLVDGEPLPEPPEGGRRGGFRGRGGRPGSQVRGTIMTITLPESVASGASVKLSMDWKYRVPKRGAPRNGHEEFHTYYLGYWYPQFAVFDDVSGWVAEQYFSNAEFYMGYADYDLQFTAPRGWLVRATGSLENPEEVLTETARERLANARKGRDVVEVISKEDLDAGRVTRTDNGEKLTWHYKASGVRDCAVSISDRYVWDATHAVIPNRDGPGVDGVAMIHAVYRTDGRGFDRAAEYARHTIEYMSELVHPYQWPHMTVCGGVIGGGMEFPMMTICGSGSQGLVAHELIHMWFPMLAGSNEKAHAWQDEGFTSFFTTLTSAAFRKRPPSSVWDVRGYLRTAAGGESAPLMTHGDYYPGGGRGGYGFASYSKSAAILTQLRGLLGDELFFETFRKYAADWAFKHPNPRDYFNAFSKAAGRDLDWYFRTWYYETWTLDQAIESVRVDGDSTEVIIADLRYATYPTEVEVTFESGEKETRRIDVAHWLSGRKTKTLRFPTGVTKVEIDPRKVTLDLSRGNNVWEK